MKLFDCNAWAGVALKPPLRPAVMPEDLLQEMDNCGVDEALVHHAGGDFSNPVESNPEVAEFCQASDRLHPAWNILPPQTGEMDPEALFSEMKQNGVKTLRAMPTPHKYLLNEVTMGPLLKKLIIRRIPLFVAASMGWHIIHDILKAFPELILIASDHGCWGEDRFFRPLLEAYPDFYIDTSRYELAGGLEDLVAKYGPNRILFGTAFHHISMGGASLLLRHAEISEEARTMIAHTNLERLLGEVQI